jgi:hypothetical protein
VLLSDLIVLIIVKRMIMISKILNVLSRLIAYLFIATVFWIPLYYLVKILGFYENIALIAVSIGILPLLFLFVPAFQSLIDRISSFKLPGFEIEFKKAIEESVRGNGIEQVPFIIDQGKEHMYDKADMPKFLETIRRFFPIPSTRLVLSIDLINGNEIFLPMVYFQSRKLLSLFDLRAIFFIDSRHKTIERHVLGTLDPNKALELIDKYIGDLDNAYKIAMNQNLDTVHHDEDFDNLTLRWQIFFNQIFNKNINLTLTDEVFRSVFSDHLEVNIISYPFDDYGLLLNYLDPSRKHLILIRGNEIINVRSIDRVAREIAQIAIKSSMFHSNIKNRSK